MKRVFPDSIHFPLLFVVTTEDPQLKASDVTLAKTIPIRAHHPVVV